MPWRIKAPDIRLEDVSVGYGERVVLQGISTTLPSGKISVILGGSGSGKSTLLRNILGLFPLMAGRIWLGDRDFSTLQPDALVAVRRQMGVLFPEGALLGSLRLGENIALPLWEHTALGDTLIQEVVRMKLKLVGLEDFIDYFPSQLSTGMRKRAGLARALALDPAVLLCDEPTSGLDPVTSADMDQLVLELKATFEMTIVVVSHDLLSLLTIADHVVMLDKGKMLFEGKLEDLLRCDDPIVVQFLEHQPSRDSLVLGKMTFRGTGISQVKKSGDA